MSITHPVIGLVCLLTVLLQIGGMFLLKSLRRKGKQIPQRFIAVPLVALWVLSGTVISLLTNSNATLTIVFILGSGFIGVIQYVVLRFYWSYVE